MGAGARLAEERGRWPVHWQLADLERQSEQLIAALDPEEQLQLAVPALALELDPGMAIVVGVTDRRLLAAGTRLLVDEPAPPSEVWASSAGMRATLAERGITLDLDEAAATPVWAPFGPPVGGL